METETETYAFSADINQLLSLIINTIYSNKEVFLREIISNSSDALNKLRYQSLTDSKCLESDPNLEISISFDHENKILIITDTGIGMTKDELINNLGTIASSGTKKFIENLSATKDVNLIGQFGVGFYSAYLVATKVVVVSKNNDDDQYVWESEGNGSFSILKDTSSVKLNRGTKMSLYLKDDMYDYLEESKIKDLVKKHSNFIDFPIKLQMMKTKEVEVEVEVPETNEPVATTDGVTVDGVTTDGVTVDGVTTDGVTTKKEMKTESYVEFDQLNTTKPIWTRNPKEITEEEYSEFYKSLTGDYDNELEHLHFSVEGQVDFKALLYIPKRAPYDLFDGQTKRKSDIKLYVKKVFITDDFDDTIPEYLKFVRGVIETDDIPLNISRETLQQNKVMKIIGKNIVKKIIEIFSSISDDSEKFRIFYEQYSKQIKIGIHEDTTNRTKLAGLLRYETSKSNGDLISLDEYIDNLVEGQSDIYYMTSDSIKSVEVSPFLNYYKKNNYEVLFMVDVLDEYVTQQLRDYKEKKLVCITKNSTTEDNQEEYKQVCNYFKSILQDQVEKIVVSNKVIDFPCIISTPEYSWTSNMQRIASSQTNSKADTMQFMSKKILEINNEHEIIIKIKEKLNSNPEANMKDLVMLLFNVACNASGFQISDTFEFNKQVLNLVKGSDLLNV